MKKTYFFVLLSLLSLTMLHAQQPHSCATPAEKSEWLIQYQRNKQAFPRTFDTIYVPMTIHLLGNDSGAGYFPLNKVLNAVCELNEDFASSGIRFYIEGAINYINNTDFWDHESFGPGFQMMETHNVDNTINCYFVENPAEACGYSIYGLGVALGHNCMGPGDNTWAHEMGHAFSLPHTFYGWEGSSHSYSQPAPEEVDGVLVERASGLGCENAGDGFCDTPADYLNDRWNCNSEGMSNSKQLDPDSVQFRSDATFFMSYSLDVCAARFSAEQIAAMRANLVDERANFLYDQTPVYPVPDSFGLVSPANGETVLAATDVLLTWEPTPNATHYYVQVSPLPSFGGVVFSGVVEGLELQLTNLDPGRKYYWRMRPFNKVFTCANFGSAKNFTMGAITAASEPEILLSQLVVFPNPANSGRNINVAFQADEAKLLNVRVVNMFGVTVWEQAFQSKIGANRLEVAALSHTGIYALVIEGRDAGKNGQIVRPLILMD